MSEVLSPRGPCRFCVNARCCPDLSDDNDGSDMSIGCIESGFSFYIASGFGRPVQLLIDRCNRSSLRNELMGFYFPKFCPECGRSLTEDYPEHRSVYDKKEK